MEDVKNVVMPNADGGTGNGDSDQEKDEINGPEMREQQACAGEDRLHIARVGSGEKDTKANWLGTAIVITLIAVMAAHGIRSNGLSKEKFKTCYIIIGTIIIGTIMNLIKKIGDGKADYIQISKKIGLCLMLLIVPFVIFGFIEGHSFVTDVICRVFCPIETKQFSFCVSEAALVFLYPKMFNANFSCPSKKDDNKILSEKIGNATESLRQHITETCGESGKTIDIEKIQVEMKTICRLEVEKNTAQDFVQIIKHFDAQESYTRCDEERHSVIQQLKQVQSGMTLLNQTVEEQRKRMQETSRDTELSSQALLFGGSISAGYLQSTYIGASSTTLGHVKDCTHATIFYKYNNYIQRISDLSKGKGNRPLQIKSAFLAFAKDLLAFDVQHESHEVFRHLKHRVVSDVGLLNVCNIWNADRFHIDLRDNANGFKDVTCMMG